MSETLIKLEGALTIAKAESLHHELEDAYQAAEPVKLDASEVSRVDTAILQLILSFMTALRSKDVTVEWAGTSEEFVSGAKILGLDQQLNF